VNEPADPLLSRLAGEIRAEAATLAPPARADAVRDTDDAAALPAEHPQRRDYRLDELVHVHQDAFVERAWRCLVKRAPRPEELLAALDRLQAGESKIALLGDLRRSAEGRRHAVRVRGLAPRYAFWRLCRMPVIGGLVERLALIAALPAIAREQRRLGQWLAAREAEPEVASLAAEVAALREELATLRRERATRPPA